MEPSAISAVALDGAGAADLGQPGGPAEVSALCFHPSLPLVTLAATGPQGSEVMQADALSGEVLLRVRTRRHVRILRHFDLGDVDSAVLVVAFSSGDIEVWDCDTLALREKFAPSRKEVGKAAVVLACSFSGGLPVAFVGRGGSAVERIVLVSQKGKGSKGKEKPLRNDGRWKPVTAISVDVQSGSVAIGHQDGDVRFLDGRTLQVAGPRSHAVSRAAFDHGCRSAERGSPPPSNPTPRF
ncbi:hypothetical protein T484DRAFT_1745253 [Baffinella frigidus]|nr:hypothetical protein T484DRAFT_1745253 [Cryptophyta sp. CCMP2293]